MVQENPYQSPESELQQSPALFSQYPTWKFWALIFLSTPGTLTILIEPRYSSDPALGQDWMGRNFGFIWLAALAFTAWAVWSQWPTPATHIKSLQKFTCVISIVGFTLVAAIYLGHFIASMTYFAFFSNQTIHLMPPSSRVLLFIPGLFATVLPAWLGFALAFDAIGRPLKRRPEQLNLPDDKPNVYRKPLPIP